MSLFAFEVSEPAKVIQPNTWTRGRYDPSSQAWVRADGIRCADGDPGGGGGGTTYECGWMQTGSMKVSCDFQGCWPYPDKDPYYCAD